MSASRIKMPGADIRDEEQLFSALEYDRMTKKRHFVGCVEFGSAKSNRKEIHSLLRLIL